MTTRTRRTKTKKTSRPPADPDERPAQNPGGPVTEEDPADARAVLGFLAGFGSDRRAALDESRPHDHLGPGYNPNRIVRILAALREILPEEIEDWKYGRLSRAAAEKLWEEHLFSRRCGACEKRCHGCRVLAGALGYERGERTNGTRTWRRPEKEARRLGIVTTNSRPLEDGGGFKRS